MQFISVIVCNKNLATFSEAPKISLEATMNTTEEEGIRTV